MLSPSVVDHGFEVLVLDNIVIFTNVGSPHQWYNALRAGLKCGRSWVRAQIGTIQRL